VIRLSTRRRRRRGPRIAKNVLVTQNAVASFVRELLVDIELLLSPFLSLRESLVEIKLCIKQLG